MCLIALLPLTLLLHLLFHSCHCRLAVVCDLGHGIGCIVALYISCSCSKCDWFPVHLLPDVVGPDVRVGVLQSPWHGIPKGVGVGVGLGDLQCSVLSAAIGQEERSAGV